MICTAYITSVNKQQHCIESLCNQNVNIFSNSRELSKSYPQHAVTDSGEDDAPLKVTEHLKVTESSTVSTISRTSVFQNRLKLQRFVCQRIRRILTQAPSLTHEARL